MPSLRRKFRTNSNYVPVASSDAGSSIADQNGVPRALSSGKPRKQLVASLAMFKLLIVVLSILVATASAELPSKKYLNLAAIKTMVAAAEAEAQKLHVEVTLCVVDESGNLLFLQKADAASLNTIQFAQRKARHAAFYRSPSKEGADALKKGNVDVLAFPDFFPNQGGLPIQVDGQTVGAIAASGAKSEIDEAIAQAAIDALLKK
jgi:glc operon protein GlcG